VYFDVLKDRLYTAAPKSHSRRSAQTVLHRLLYALVRLCAPILAFTTEEVWRHMGLEGSVHTALFPEPAELTAGITSEQRKRAENWDRLMEVRQDVLKSLEIARQEKFIGAPLEARVRLSANGDLYPLLEAYAADLPALFIVSEVELSPGTGDVIEVKVERAAGAKCERCWKYKTDIGSNAAFPTICATCSEAVEEILHA
jgi:isoleucyl-tRNA synthetase